MIKQIRPIRLLAIMKLLQLSKNTTMASMCRLFKCSKRIIYRDIKLLRKLRVPIFLKDDIYRLNKSAWARVSAKDLLRKR